MEIGIWGDSITYGKCDSEGLGWVGRVRKSFSIDDRTGVYNRGVCGDTTEDLLKRFAIEVESIHPNTILFAIGINDSKYPLDKEDNRVPLDEFKQNMQTLIDKAKRYTDRVLIAGATKVNEGALKSQSRFTNEQIGIYNETLKEVAKRNELAFIDTFDVLDIDTDLHDGLHPNAEGYAKLAEVISKSIPAV